jgi:uncharacterized protein (DUF1778 family)
MIIIQLNVIDDEYAAIKAFAAAASLSLTTYIITAAVDPARFVGLIPTAEVKADHQAVSAGAEDTLV